jgi:hypothetical protein
MKHVYVICFLCLMACGGSGSPTGSGTGSGNGSGSGGETPQSTTPTVRDRSFTLSKLSIDSGASLFEMVPPDVTGRLDMRANGAYTLTFAVALHNFSWSETVTGTHTFSGNTLRLTPANNIRTSVEPFRQTVIIDTLSLTWQSDAQVVVPLPIRPGAWRSEDVISLTFTQAVASKPVFVANGKSREAFNYVALIHALKNRSE